MNETAKRAIHDQHKEQLSKEEKVAEYVYMSSVGNLKRFFKTIQSAGVPQKLTQNVLEGLGYKSKNDRPIIKIMKKLGFCGFDGVPTERWKTYRNKSHSGAVIAEAILEHYSDLFQTYPDANQRDSEALRNFFSSRTSLGSGGLTQMVRTFQTLAELGDFAAQIPSSLPASPVKSVTPAPGKLSAPFNSPSGQAVIHINIQLTLPEGATSDTFESFFKAMKQHLLS